MANNVILEGHTWTFRLGQYKHTLGRDRASQVCTSARRLRGVCDQGNKVARTRTLSLGPPSRVISAGFCVALNLPAWPRCAPPPLSECPPLLPARGEPRRKQTTQKTNSESHLESLKAKAPSHSEHFLEGYRGPPATLGEVGGGIVRELEEKRKDGRGTSQ